jgi:protein-S-isoprenylcysteine O-methyltransferase Ste14
VKEPYDRMPRRRPTVANLAATGLTITLLVTTQLVEAAGPSWLKVIAVALLLLAIIFIFLPFIHLSRYGKPGVGNAYFQTTQVADRGLYGIVRHPQYLGYTLVAIGFACLNPHPLVVGLGVGAWALFYAQSVLEERFCCAKFGPEYRIYMQRVPRLNFLLGLFKMMRRRGTAASLD